MKWLLLDKLQPCMNKKRQVPGDNDCQLLMVMS